MLYRILNTQSWCFNACTFVFVHFCEISEVNDGQKRRRLEPAGQENRSPKPSSSGRLDELKMKQDTPMVPSVQSRVQQLTQRRQGKIGLTGVFVKELCTLAGFLALFEMSVSQMTCPCPQSAIILDYPHAKNCYGDEKSSICVACTYILQSVTSVILQGEHLWPSGACQILGLTAIYSLGKIRSSESISWVRIQQTPSKPRMNK